MVVEEESGGAGLYVKYADGSIFELYVLRCDRCGCVIDPEQGFHLLVAPAPAAPCILTIHSCCAS
jgi:hypothetical protein